MSDILISPAFEPFLKDHYRYKIAFGGRGGGKSENIARCLLVMAMRSRLRIACVREIQKSIRQSVHTLFSDLIRKYELIDYQITEREIRNVKTGSEFLFSGLQDHTADSLKSMANIDIAWIEEGQSITEKSLNIFTPTIRKSGSEIWISYNRYLYNDAVHGIFNSYLQGSGLEKTFKTYVWTEWRAENAIAIKVNYDANPWFTDENRTELESDKLNNPELYNYKWLGHPLSMGDNCLIPLKSVLESINREVKEWEHISIGCDPARYGDDESVIFVRNGFRVLPAITFRGVNTSRLATEIIRICRDYYTQGYTKTIEIKVDDTGLGAGVTDQLETAQNNEKIKPNPAFNLSVLPLVNNAEAGDPDYKDLGTELWGNVKKALETVSLPDDQELIEQLTNRRYHIEPDGRIKLERKEDMKKRGIHSPDRADALALCLYNPQNYDFSDTKIERKTKT